MISYTLDTLNVMACTAVGTKLCGFSNEDITSISLFMGITSLVHKIGINVFKHFYEKTLPFMSGLKDENIWIEDKDKKTGKIIYREATLEERMSMPMFVISCLLAYKVTELIFKKISEECLKKSLMFLSMALIINSHNLRKLFI